MRYAPQRTGGFHARRPARSPQEIRKLWCDAISLASRLADEAHQPVSETRVPDPGFGQSLTRLTLALRDLESGNFPVGADSARTMATAFLKLSRDFCHPAWTPQARTACAPFLGAGAKCLDGLIDTLRNEEAERGRRVLGEREDD